MLGVARLGLKTDMFIISTDADQVYLDFRRPTQRGVRQATVAEMTEYQKQGQFPPGSMDRKSKRALRYLHSGGEKVIITSPERLLTPLTARREHISCHENVF